MGKICLPTLLASSSLFLLTSCNLQESGAKALETPAPTSTNSSELSSDIDSSHMIIDQLSVNIDFQLKSDAAAIAGAGSANLPAEIPQSAPTPNVLVLPAPVAPGANNSSYLSCEDTSQKPNGNGLFVRIQKIDLKVNGGGADKIISLSFEAKNPLWINLENPSLSLNQDFSIGEIKPGDSLLGARVYICQGDSFYQNTQKEFPCQVADPSGLDLKLSTTSFELQRDYQLRITLQKSLSYALSLDTDSCVAHPFLIAEWFRSP